MININPALWRAAIFVMQLPLRLWIYLPSWYSQYAVDGESTSHEGNRLYPVLWRQRLWSTSDAEIRIHPMSWRAASFVVPHSLRIRIYIGSYAKFKRNATSRPGASSQVLLNKYADYHLFTKYCHEEPVPMSEGSRQAGPAQISHLTLQCQIRRLY